MYGELKRGSASLTQLIPLSLKGKEKEILERDFAPLLPTPPLPFNK
jgi:hypothetical protein